MWKSKGLSNAKSSSVTISYRRVSQPVYNNARVKGKFNADLLKQNRITYNHGPMVNINIVYRLILTTKDPIFTLQNCLFGVVKLTKNTHIDNYKYSGYGIGFDSRGTFSRLSGAFGK